MPTLNDLAEGPKSRNELIDFKKSWKVPSLVLNSLYAKDDLSETSVEENPRKRIINSKITSIGFWTQRRPTHLPLL